MRKLPALYFCLLLPAIALTQDFRGKYTGWYNGDPVVLNLTGAGQNTYTGDLNDNHNLYKVTATARGNTLKGQCTEPSLGLTMELSGVLDGATLALSLNLLGTTLALDLKKMPDPATAPATTTAAAAAPAQRQHDPALVGRWTRQSNYSSGYGRDGSMSSESSMILLADGHMADAGSKTAVGGADWSGSASAQGSGVIEGLFWYTEKQNLYLQAAQNGTTETQLLGHYYIENGHMLITGQDGTKVLFYRG